MERRNSRRRPAVTAEDESPVSSNKPNTPTARDRDIGKGRQHVRSAWNALSGAKPRSLIVFFIVLTCISILLLWFLPLSAKSAAKWLLGDGLTSPRVAGQQHGLASSFLLHPEDHVDRDTATIRVQWNVTKGFRSPDGVRKSVYLINGMFPGPTLEARSGDRIVVDVHNGLQDEGLAFHWHGLQLRGANHMDGAVGITQKAIHSGEDFVYDFTVGEDEAGTFWYHGHEKTQRDDGLFGGYVVHSPRHRLDEKVEFGYDEEILVLVGDWYHRPSTEVLEWYMSSRGFGNEVSTGSPSTFFRRLTRFLPMKPVPDSLILNGRGSFDCAMAVPARPVECLETDERDNSPILQFDMAKRYRLRLVNTG